MVWSYSRMENGEKKSVKRIVIALIVGLIFGSLCYILLHSASWKRSVKSLASDYGGGLNRTVTVYDYDGKEIKSWSGKFDVNESETEVYFDDEDGKRVIIHGGIVINEEE